MGWLEALKGALLALPKLLDVLQGLGQRLDALVIAHQERQAQEIRNEQRFAALETLKLKSDQERMEMARRISELERRLK